MKKFIVIKQHDLTDCGPACLSSIIQYYDGYVPIETIRLKCKTNNEGTTALNLINAANSYGLSAQAIKVEDIRKVESNLPCIVHVVVNKSYHHYMVLCEIKNTYLLLMDPAKGRIKMPMNEFYEIYSKVAILLRPNSTLVRYKKPQTFLSIIYDYIKNEKRKTAKIFISSTLIILFSLLSSYFIKVGYQTVTRYHNSFLLLYVSIMFGMIYLCKNFFEYLKNCQLSSFSKNLSSCLYEKFSHQLFILPLNFIRSKTSGEIVSRYNELEEINSIIPDLITSFVLDLIMVLISFIFLLSISKQLTVILMIFMTVYFVISFALKNPTLQKISNNMTNLSDFNTSIIDSVNTLVSTKFLNNEVNMEKRLEKKGVNYLYNRFHLERYFCKCDLLRNIIYNIGMWITFSFGLYLIFLNKLNIIDLFTFEILLSYFTEPIKDISAIIPKYCFIKASMYKLSEYEIIKEEDTGKNEFVNGDITIKKLSYSYNNLDKTLSNISLKINKNDKVLIKGKSGSGKSTLCKIISRQLDYSSGLITINDININDIKLSELRKNITYIGQKDNLIIDSILENIIFERNISEKEFKTVCNICEIDEIASKKFDKYNSMINDQSNNISGGERQRIILARGLLNSGNIIILDEALSEVNQDMERRILRKMFHYLKDKTIIYVSHKNYNNLFNREYMIG